MSSVISIKIPNTKRKLISAALLCFWCVLTAAGCQVGSFSSHSPSRSGEAEQLPWQHKWNGDTGTVSFHASLPQTHWQTPTSSDIRAPFTHSPSSPTKKVSQYSENHSKRVRCRPAKPRSRPDIKTLSWTCFLSSLLPLPSAPTHACLLSPAKQQCGTYTYTLWSSTSSSTDIQPRVKPSQRSPLLLYTDTWVSTNSIEVST